jgi:hypothetical protein
MLRAVARWPKLRRNGCNRGGAPERPLVSADAAGYSRLMAADELATIQTIKGFRL